MIYKQAQIEKYLKKPEPEIKAFVIYGGNDGLVAEYVKSLTLTVSKDLYDPFQVVYFNGSDITAEPANLFAEYTARSLMGGRRVIVIKDADNNLTKHLKVLLEGTPSDTLILIASSSLNKKSSLVTLGEGRDDMAVVACYEDRDEDIFSTARKMLVDNNLMISNEALQLLCARLSNDRRTNIGEIEKLITYMGDKKNVGIEDIQDVIADQSASSSDDLYYYTACGYSDKSQKSLRKLLNEGEEPVSIIRGMVYHFYKILNCLANMEKGDTPEKAMQKLTPRVIYFRESAFKKQLAIWNKETAFSVMDLLYKCERDCKTTNMPVQEIVSYTLMQISSKADRVSKQR